jgi:hypothetical protein
VKLALLMICAALAGCSTARPEYLSNRLSCTLDGGKALITSMWGQVGFSSYLDPRDAEVACAPTLNH